MALNDPTIAISEFKATCLKVLDQVKRTGKSVVVTRRGEPIALVSPPPPARRGTWLGKLHASATITGDVISPAVELDVWEAHRS
jgi:prevent-host-death family protein